MSSLTRLSQFVAILAAAATAPAVLAQACFTFADTFAPHSSQWSNLRGNWVSSNSEYYPLVPNNNPTTYTHLPFDFRDFTLKVTVVAIGDGGVWIRTDGTGNNGILLVLGGGGYGQGVRNGVAGTQIYTHRVINGNYSSPIGQVDGVFTPGQNYDIRLRVVGTHYSIYINGSSTPITQFDDNTFDHGFVGLYDDQPNTAAGGFGPPMKFSNFRLNGNLVDCICAADFNHDSIIDFFDYLDFVDAFSSSAASSDYNGDEVIDFFDYLDFVDVFSAGC